MTNSFYFIPCVLNKLHRSAYHRTPSGNPYGFSLSNLRYFPSIPFLRTNRNSCSLCTKKRTVVVQNVKTQKILKFPLDFITVKW